MGMWRQGDRVSGHHNSLPFLPGPVQAKFRAENTNRTHSSLPHLSLRNPPPPLSLCSRIRSVLFLPIPPCLPFLTAPQPLPPPPFPPPSRLPLPPPSHLPLPPPSRLCHVTFPPASREGYQKSRPPPCAHLPRQAPSDGAPRCLRPPSCILCTRLYMYISAPSDGAPRYLRP